MERPADARVLTVPETIQRGMLGLGSVTEPKTRTWVLRSIFFSVTEKEARPAIDALSARCKPAFAELKRISKELLPLDHSDFPALVIVTATTTSNTSRLHDVTDWKSLCVAADHFPAAAELRSIIWKWADERKLAVEWFLDAAYLMLCIGAQFPGLCPWSYGGAYGISPGGLRVGGPFAGLLLRLKSKQPVPVPQPYNPALGPW